MASVTSEVDANPKAKGLAIIITNDYIGTPEFPHKLDELNGTIKDGEHFWNTFSSLKFVVHWEHNVNRERLGQIMYEVKHLKHKKVKDYKCVVLVFSGHGTSGNYVYMHDRKEVNISEHLIAPLLPESVKDLGSIPKLFFIDACRGSKTMKTVVVPKGKSASEGTSPSRGSSLISNLKVPAKGNFLVAYSTMPEYRAYEDGAGGIWLTVLAKKIMDSPGVSIGDVLTDVNEELLEMTQSKEFVVQQPEQLNRLNKKVFLLETEDEQASAANLDTAGEVMPSSQRRKPIINIAAVFPGCNPSPMLESGSRPQLAMQLGNSQPQPHVYHTPIMNTPLLATSSHGQCISTTQQHSQGSSPETITIQPAVQYETMLIEFAHSNCTNPPTYETVHCFSNEHNRLYFKSCVTVHLRNGITIKEDSRQYYISQQLSQEEAAKNACEVIAQRQMHYQQAPPQYNGTHPLNRQRPQVHSPACSVSVTTQVYTQPHAASTRPLIQGQQSYNGPSCSASIPPPLPLQPGTSNLYTHAAVSGKGLPPSGSDRERLNYFFQANKVNPQYDYVSDNTGGQPRYRCTIKYFMNGKTERVDSGGYYHSKGEAKEFAAKKVLIKETKGGTFEAVSKNTTPQDKIWKSKLKEYYDKRGQPNAPIDYKTFEVALERFQSTVFTGDFGPGGVQGDVCENKKEAEQSAARKAVKMLNQSVCGISND